jgi:LmbE family N-acetylglucosaminyl deacetylase
MRVLVLAAHPDDEVLGCGGTMARLVNDGAQVHVHILGEGVTSRFESRGAADESLLRALHEESQRAGQLLGVDVVELHDLPDNRFDAEALLDIIKVVEQLVHRIDPEVIYTHHGGDLNIDHRIVHQAVLVATRPVTAGGVRDVYACEVPSSTEWTFHQIEPCFRPNVFVDISETLEKKIEAMKAYSSEIREFPHPRSREALEAAARRWGAVAGFQAAEAFQLIRSLRQETVL